MVVKIKGQIKLNIQMVTTYQVPAGKTDHEEVEGLRNAFSPHHGDGHDVDLGEVKTKLVCRIY